MAHLQHRPDSAPTFDPPRVWIEPVSEHRVPLDGTWWPRSNDLNVELPGLLPVLDQARGPVVRLLLGAAGWATRPHHVVLADRTVSVGYLADQPPSMMTVLCADGVTCAMRVVPSGSTSGAPEDESDH
jgi:Family of unknown function (DUF5994)